MPDLPEDPKMKGHLISLAFHEIDSSEEIHLPNAHHELLYGSPAKTMGELPDEARQTKTHRIIYKDNKIKVGLTRETTYHDEGFCIESLTYSKKGIEAGLTFNTDNRRQVVKPFSNEERLETSIEKAFSKLPEGTKFQKHSTIVYNQLLAYIREINQAESNLTK